MEPLTTTAAILLMLLFAAGVLGCAFTIPMCAVKFFAILFEPDQAQASAPPFALGSQYSSPPIELAEETAEAPPERPRARGASAAQ